MAVIALVCWHCDSINLCDCAFCGHYISGGSWVAGPCVACKGSKENEELFSRPEMADIDPRERRHWTLVRTITGGNHRVFTPQV